MGNMRELENYILSSIIFLDCLDKLEGIELVTFPNLFKIFMENKKEKGKVDIEALILTKQIESSQEIFDILNITPTTTGLETVLETYIIERNKYLKIEILRESINFIQKGKIEEGLNTLSKLSMDKLKEDKSFTSANIKGLYKDHLTKDTSYIKSGFDSLKDHPFWRGELNIIAGRPSMGKTALALNLWINFLKKNKRGIFFSYEMPSQVLVMRAMASATKIDFHNLRFKTISEEDLNKTDLFEDWLSKKDFEIITNIKKNSAISELIAIAKDRHSKKELDYIIIDYLQLIRSDNDKTTNRNSEIENITRDLKGLSVELNIPVILLAQLSRAPEQRANRRPVLSDLRDSGAIEQDADVVIFLYRDEYYNEKSEAKGILEVIFAKDRNGSTETNYLRFFSNIQKMADYTSAIK